MKLYDHTLAPNPRRVRIYLSEKGIDVPLVPVDVRNGEARSPEMMAKNPIGGIPVLELDDGTCLSESVTICKYLEELHPEPPLFGTTAIERATIDMWLRRVEFQLMVPTGLVWVHGHPLTAHLVDQIPAVADQNRVRVHKTYQLLDDQLAQHSFFAGDSYSITDAVALATLDFAVNLVGIPYSKTLVNLTRWHELASSRPSASA